MGGVSIPTCSVVLLCAPSERKGTVVDAQTETEGMHVQPDMHVAKHHARCQGGEINRDRGHADACRQVVDTACHGQG